MAKRPIPRPTGRVWLFGRRLGIGNPVSRRTSPMAAAGVGARGEGGRARAAYSRRTFPSRPRMRAFVKWNRLMARHEDVPDATADPRPDAVRGVLSLARDALVPIAAAGGAFLGCVAGRHPSGLETPGHGPCGRPCPPHGWLGWGHPSRMRLPVLRGSWAWAASLACLTGNKGLSASSSYAREGAWVIA